MKKILLFIVALVATLSMNAQTTEIHNASGKVAAYLGADVTVKFGVAGDGQPTLEVYKGGELQKTYKGSEYKVVSTPVEETFKAVYDTNGGVLTFYYDANDHSGDSITVYEDGTANYLFDDNKGSHAKWGYDDVRENVSKVVIDESVKKYSSLTSTAGMFMNMKYATGISGAEYLDVANVTDMSEMFRSYGCDKTDFNAVPNVSGWNTGNVKNMSQMFFDYGQNSTSLTVVPDVSGWNTGNVINMSSIFGYYGYNSTSLAVVPDVSKWNTGNVINMSSIFGYYGYKSTSLAAFPAVNGWKTDKVTRMDNMFSYYGNYGDGKPNNIECVLDLSGWNLANVTSARNVFNFKPKTFEVTIPGKTGDKANDASHWYYGDGTNSITPPEGKLFTMFGTGSAAVNAGAGISGNKVKWIQLWEGGPKFAECNVGVTDGKAESYGGYYTWGGSTNMDSKEVYKDSDSALTGTDDTATNLWGSNWRMPTKTELDTLLAKCTVEWTTVEGVKGRKFTGKGDYASNSVFLPAAGYCRKGIVSDQGNTGYYWSSTPRVFGDSWMLHFESGFQTILSGYRYGSYSVRAVVKEPTTGTAKATIGGEEVDVNWVQLWENGPKFAEKNVGASSATETGTQMTFTNATKTGADYVWGANWCTPSKEDMEHLMTAAKGKTDEKVKCEYTQEGSQYGFKFTGLTDGYTDNSVFFPAQDGYSNLGRAYYWSGTAEGNVAWGMDLYYNSNNGNWRSDWYSLGWASLCLVRPVFKN